jgi:lipoprotein-anchoring transpeptidase ErfK/SrfK
MRTRTSPTAAGTVIQRSSTGSFSIGSYPASHGCVRRSTSVASWTYGFAFVGMPVKVIGGS